MGEGGGEEGGSDDAFECTVLSPKMWTWLYKSGLESHLGKNIFTGVRPSARVPRVLSLKIII